MKTYDLKNLLDDFELPVKPGMWETIAPKIPDYKKRKKRRILYFFVLPLLGIGSAMTFYLYTPKQNGFSAHSQTIIASTQSTPTNKVQEENNAPTIATSDAKTTLSAPKFSTPKKQSSPLIAKAKKATNRLKTPFAILHSSSPSIIPHTTSTNAFATATDASEAVFFKPHYQALKPISKNNTNSDVLSPYPLLGKTNTKAKAKYFIGIAYNSFKSNLLLSPSLMTLDKGKGRGFYFEGGRYKNNWRFSSHLAYSNIQQHTKMPGAYNATYMNVLQTNFKTALPDDYAYKMKDTASLAVPGTTHDFIDQSLQFLSAGSKADYAVYNKTKLQLRVGYAFDFNFLLKSNTFFWDSVNYVAVPMTQKDNQIVFRNNFASTVHVAITVPIAKHLSFEATPYYQINHTPFIKHYYKVSLRNTGINIGLQYSF
jgi:hypothetical protein